MLAKSLRASTLYRMGRVARHPGQHSIGSSYVRVRIYIHINMGVWYYILVKKGEKKKALSRGCVKRITTRITDEGEREREREKESASERSVEEKGS